MGCGTSAVLREVREIKNTLEKLSEERRILPEGYTFEMNGSEAHIRSRKAHPRRVSLSPRGHGANMANIIKEHGNSDKVAEIFISYNWESQGRIKLMKDMLEKETGSKCWMDTCEMDGGQGLFTKISEGMKNAKIVLACVTKAYCKSPMCQREVFLATDRKKIVLPLLLDKMEWPVDDGLDFAFAGILYIDCIKEEFASAQSTAIRELLGAVRNALRGDRTTEVTNVDHEGGISHPDLAQFWNSNFDSTKVQKNEFNSKFSEFVKQRARTGTLLFSEEDMERIVEDIDVTKDGLVSHEEINQAFPPGLNVEYALKMLSDTTNARSVPNRQLVCEFVGRDDERLKLVERLQHPGVTFVTGKTGIGKTHLMVRSAHDVLNDGLVQPSDIYFFKLRGIDSKGALVHRFCQTVMPGDHISGGSMQNWLKSRSHESPTVILLDDTESAIQASRNADGFFADFILKICRECPSVSLVIASCEMMDLRETPNVVLELSEWSEAESLRVINADKSALRSGGSSDIATSIADVCSGHPLVVRMVLSALMQWPDAFDLGTAKEMAKNIVSGKEALSWVDQLITFLPDDVLAIFCIASVFPVDVDSSAVEYIYGDVVVDGLSLLAELSMLEYDRYKTQKYSMRRSIKSYLLTNLIPNLFDGVVAENWRKKYLEYVSSECVRKPSQLVIEGKGVAAEANLDAYFDDVSCWLSVLSSTQPPQPFVPGDFSWDDYQWLPWGEALPFLRKRFEDKHLLKLIEGMVDNVASTDHFFLRWTLEAWRGQFFSLQRDRHKDAQKCYLDVEKKLSEGELTHKQKCFFGVLYFFLCENYSKLQDPSKSIEYGKRAVEVLEKSKQYKDVYYRLADVLTSIGFAMESQGEPDEDVAVYYRHALEVSPLKETHVLNSRAMNQLGALLSRTDEPKEGLEKLECALRARQRHFGPVSKPCMTSHNLIAQALSRTESYKEAHDQLLQSVKIGEQLVPNSPAVATTYKLLGDCLLQMGRRDEAIQYYRKCKTIRTEFLGDSHRERKEIDEIMERFERDTK